MGLVNVTSPPYPMIAMWDDVFGVDMINPMVAWEEMHRQLDETWENCNKMLCDGGFVCINIGDATRTFDGIFQVFPNHARIIQKFLGMGYTMLPEIFWYKPTNAPNKFMGSGMLPAGAYVTNECEHILIFKKEGKRNVNKELRRESAFFYHERNIWFSNIWSGINGVNQKLGGVREKSASFPLEIPYRLVNMYSVKGDTVYDPYAGLGTTALACMCSGRSSVNCEIISELCQKIREKLMISSEFCNNFIDNRLKVAKNTSEGKHFNKNYDFQVKTKQETNLKLDYMKSINENLEVEY